MDKFPLQWKGKTVGELTAEGEALYTWFSARCRLPGEGLWCAWAVGDRGELRLGVLEPAGEQAAIRRRFSGRMTAPLGRLMRGEVRPAADRGDSVPWQRLEQPECVFRTAWLRRQLRGVPGLLTRKEGGRCLLAVPYNSAKPFPLPSLFCFASFRNIQGKSYAVFAFDEAEFPVF